MNEDYDSLDNVLHLAYNRAATGKGAERHSRGEPFEQQWICRGARTFGLGGLLFQIGKKNEELMKMEDRERKINELLDIVNYACAAVIVLSEEKEPVEKEPVEKDKGWKVTYGPVENVTEIYINDKKICP